ncbi:MAG: hypothetical protein ABIE23_01360 [archaeon]|nr:hypothetical protein [Candidatus Micrarchaeota archaeon]
MDCKVFLKPTLFKVIIFIVLVIVFYLILSSIYFPIFHCYTQPVRPDLPPLPLKESFCGLPGLAMMIGVKIVFSPLGYLTMFIVLIIIPYLISCGANSFRKKTSTS